MNSIKIPTILEITNNHLLLRDILLSNNLVETKENIDVFFKSTAKINTFSIIEQKKTQQYSVDSIHYKMEDNNLFYKIIFPDYTDSEHKQLQSLLIFVTQFFTGNRKKYININFHFSPQHLELHNDKITFINSGNFLYLHEYSGINYSNNYTPLSNLSFNYIYNSILNDFNDKIKKIYNIEKIITTEVLAFIMDETHQEYIDRAYQKQIVKPISNQEFYNNLKNITVPVIAHKENESYQDSLDNQIQVKYFESNTNSIISVMLLLKNVNYLKSILKTSMMDKDIKYLIYIISMAFFYNNLFNINENKNYFVMERVPIFLMNKIALSNMTYVYKIQIGNFRLELGLQIKIYYENTLLSEQFTLHHTYNDVFNFLSYSICNILSTEKSMVSCKDISIIEMIRS